MPSYLKPGQSQHSDVQANLDRTITKSRWIVESYHGRLKHWTFFRTQLVSNSFINVIEALLRTVTACLNGIRGPIYQRSPERDAKDRLMAERIKDRLTTPNGLAQRFKTGPNAQDNAAGSLLSTTLLASGKEMLRLNVLEEALLHGNEDMVKTLLDHGANPFKPDALKVASSSGHIDIVKLLLDRGIKPDNPSALQAASTKGHINIVKLLLDRGTNPDNKGALYQAAANGYTGIVQLLLDHGAKADRDYSLRCAAGNGHIEIVQLLLDRGANADVLSAHIPEFGGPKNKKSSSTCNMFGIANFVQAIHCNAVLTFSKIEQEIEHPMGKHLS
ncbi:ankyrin repeat and KH domain-containing protein mask-like [Pecten maximus]|uniref:ankyrin repeat and KH domain-containing protein mask-like n=1 Tax=Pecten maximus TaxID=6579 RepID=UPI0014590856|nr:ankyrin repeat and KH domain-containing protein mask-like [Pecten maximus]